MQRSTIARFCSVLIFTALSTSALADNSDSVGTKRQALGEQCSVVATVSNNGGGCGGSGGRVDVTYRLSGYADTTYTIMTRYVDRNDVGHDLAFDSYNTSRLGDYSYAGTDSAGNLTAYANFDAYSGQYVVKFYVFNSWTGEDVCTAQSKVISL